MKVKQRRLTADDVCRLNKDGMNGEYIAQNRVVLEFEDDDGHTGILYVESDITDRLGLEYIAANTKLEYSKVCDEYFPKLSQNNYYNDPTRFPERTVQVAFVDTVPGESTEVYRAIESGHYYMRQVSHREPFAKWLTAGKCEGGYVDRTEVRANITFEHKGQLEKITYDDWNGPAAYSNTFNPDFKEGKTQQLTIEDICKKLMKAHIKYRMAGDTICAYCSCISNDYDTIRLTEDGNIAVNGKIADDFEAWLYR